MDQHFVYSLWHVVPAVLFYVQLEGLPIELFKLNGINLKITCWDSEGDVTSLYQVFVDP